MGFLSSLFGGGDTPQAEESESEKAEAQLLAAMRDSYEQNGILQSVNWSLNRSAYGTILQRKRIISIRI